MEGLMDHVQLEGEFGIDMCKMRVMSPELIRKLSVKEINTVTLYDKLHPRAGSLHDLHLGTTSRYARCLTCFGTVDTCPGHFGHIELPMPMYHPIYMRYALQALKCICVHCYRIKNAKLTPKNVAAAGREGTARLSYVVRLSSNKTLCDHCGKRQPSIRKGQNFTLSWTWPVPSSSTPASTPTKHAETNTSQNQSAPGAHTGEDPEATPRKRARKTPADPDVPNGERADERQDGEGPEVEPDEPVEPVELTMQQRLAQTPLTSTIVFNLLGKVDSQTTAMLGMGGQKLTDLMLTCILVPPPLLRPAMTIVDGHKARGENAMTYKLQNLIKTILSINSNGKKRKRALDPYDILQNNIASYFVVESSSHSRGSGRGMSKFRNMLVPQYNKEGKRKRALVQRLKGKDGRVRGTLIGKRVNFSARSVISPDPLIRINELAVPQTLAKNLPVWVPVTRFNQTHCTALLKTGKVQCIGTVQNGQNGDKVLASKFKGKLVPGVHAIERDMMDGDPVMFNRQPSLHRMSMLMHRARITPDLSFKLNLAVTPPYNADFDGDEMNMHSPTNIEAGAEISELMSVNKAIISPQNSKPCISLIQDAVLGIGIISYPSSKMTRAHLMDVIVLCEVCPSRMPRVPAFPPTEEHPEGMWSGRQAIQALLPENFCASWGKEGEDNHVRFEDGLMVAGQKLTKRHLGGSAGGIVDILCHEYGNEVAALFISNAQRLTSSWFTRHGSSVGWRDCRSSKEARTDIRLRVRQLASSVKPHWTERKIIARLNEIRGVVGEHIANTKGNRLKEMVDLGSKGSMVNFSQIIGVVGQQDVSGTRPARQYGQNERTLPHFRFGHTKPESLGFVPQSFADGLDPFATFFHAMSGRIGLCNTSVSTSTTGYFQRRVVNAMHDLSVAYDGTVRNAQQTIVQLRYGNDDIDPQMLRHVAPPNTWSDAIKLAVDANRWNPDGREVAEQNRLAAREQVTAQMQAHYNDPFLEQLVDKCFELPANPCFVSVLDARRLVMGDAPKPVVPDTMVLKPLGSLLAHWCKLMSPVMAFYLGTWLFRKDVVAREDFPALLAHVELSVARAKVNPGEMVGVVGAQSIGQRGTQLSLNSFHHTGVLNRNVTHGAPRIREIVDVGKKVKTPVCTAQVEAGVDPLEVSQGLIRTRVIDVVSDRQLAPVPDWLLRGIVPDGRQPDVQLSLVRDHVWSPWAVATAVRKHFPHLLVRLIQSDLCIWVPNQVAEPDALHGEVLYHTLAQGLPGVEDVEVSKTNPREILVRGTNMVDKLSVVRGIIPESIMPNDLLTINSAFGIVTSCQYIADELYRIHADDGHAISGRHVELLAHTMCHRGTIMPVTRHGVNRIASSPFMKCAFEETVDVLFDGAMGGTKSNMRNLTESILCGGRAPSGTGSVAVIADPKYLATMRKGNNRSAASARAGSSASVPGGHGAGGVSYEIVRLDGPNSDQCELPSMHAWFSKHAKPNKPSKPSEIPQE